MRRFSVLLGLCAVGYGTWILHTERIQNAFCNSQIPGSPTTQADTACLNVMWKGVLGSVIIAAGLLLFAFTMLNLTRNRQLGDPWKNRPQPTTRYQQYVDYSKVHGILNRDLDDANEAEAEAKAVT